MTGGGYDDTTQTGVVVQSSPDPDAKMWQVTVLVDPTAAEDNEDLRAWAVCYNPKGAVPQQTGPMYTPAAQAQTAVTPQLLATAADQRTAK